MPVTAVADPGFPVGGRGPRRGAWTPEAVAFRKFCMSKRKNLDPWGACAGHAPSRSANERQSCLLLACANLITIVN